jgi:hypothetical protein
MSDEMPADTGLVKLTVNLLPANYIALTAAADRDGDTRTTVVNRALAVYDYLSDRSDEGWQLALLRGDELREVTFE